MIFLPNHDSDARFLFYHKENYVQIPIFRITHGNDLNNWSAVLLLKHDKKTFLFTGDAEEKAETDMLAKKLVPNVDVLKVGHHGAKTSTSSAFINKTKPKYAVISVGKMAMGTLLPLL
ncbi:ComEC/Rec2 family competence protein [Bacillus sp. ISL-34]|uniref:ComEC/Rec2 family competence protein n=1 Tax=Bacillus sp. ISL-34 TaxID=2819121 RepID=UPI0037BEB986